jgi:hypothetical protein
MCREGLITVAKKVTTGKRGAAGGRAAGKKKATKKASGKQAGATASRKKVAARPAAKKAAGKQAGAIKAAASAAKKVAGKKTRTMKPAARAAKKKTAGKKPARKLAASKVPARPVRRTVGRPVLDPVLLSAWRMARQGLDQPVLHAPRELAEAVGRTGWLSAADGVTPYLSLAARYTSFGRHDLDRDLYAEGTLMEMPAARGMLRLVPVSEAWLALQTFRPRVDALLKELLSRHRVMTRAALANLEDVVRAVLAGQALPVETLRTRVPQRLVKELGVAGHRHGLATSVDLALWRLWSAGEVVSRPVERRLDRRRREYVLRRDLQGPMLTADIRMRPTDEWLRTLAGRYFRWVGVARAEDLAWWADVTPADARTAIGELDLQPVSVGGLKGIWYQHDRDHESVMDFRLPDSPGVCLAPHGDLLTSCWRSSEGLMAPEDLSQPLAVSTAGHGGSKGKGTGGQHFVIIGGRVAGTWEQKPDRVLRFSTFRPQGTDVSKRLRRRAAALAAFIHRELDGPDPKATGAKAGAGLTDSQSFQGDVQGVLTGLVDSRG